MLPIPHLLLFVPFSALAALFVIVAAVNVLAGLTPRPRHDQPARPQPAAPLHSAQIIYFRPRKTSLPSTLSIGVRQRAMPR